MARFVPAPEQCRAASEKLRLRYPGADAVDLCQHAVRLAQISGAATGAVTGAASNPITMIPAAVADMATMLRIEAALAGTVGSLLEPAALDDYASLRADVLSIIFPSAVSQALRQVGIQTGERVSRAVLRKYFSEDLVRLVAKFATRVVGKEVTREAILTKAIPLVGIGIGAGWNWLEMRAVGRRAVKYYQSPTLSVK